MPTTYVEQIERARQRTDYTEGADGQRAAGVYCDMADTEGFLDFCEEAQARRNTKYQAYGLRVSWDTSELDPSNPDDVRTAVEYTYALARRLYPNSPVHIVAHIDGKGEAGEEESEGGKLHTHCEVANFDTSTGRAIKSNRSARIVRAANDDMARSWGFSVPGETVEGFEHWKERNNVREGLEKASGWKEKMDLGTLDDFERAMLEKVGSAFDAASGVDDFIERLAQDGIEIVEIHKKQKDAATGKRVEVLDSSGKPVVSCWRYVTKGADGRKHRRKDANLHRDLTRENVLKVLEKRQRVASMGVLERMAHEADRAGAPRPQAQAKAPKIKVLVSEIEKDLEALEKARRLEIMSNLQEPENDPLYKAIKQAQEDGGEDAADMLQHRIDLVSDEFAKRGETFKDKNEAVLSVLDGVVKIANDAIGALLALLMRFRFIQQQEQKRITQKAREEAAKKVLHEHTRDSRHAVEPSELLKEANEAETRQKVIDSIYRKNGI